MAQEKVTYPQGGHVSVSAAGRLSVGRNHATVWIIEYWVREFHHHPDTEANQGEQRIRVGYSACEALYHKKRALTLCSS